MPAHNFINTRCEYEVRKSTVCTVSLRNSEKTVKILIQVILTELL